MPEHKVVVTRDVGTKATAILEAQRYELVSWLEDGVAPRQWLLDNSPGASALLVMGTDKVDEELLDSAGPSLKIVSTVSVGYDHIQTSALAQRKIRLGYTPEVLTDAVADISVMLALMATRLGRESMQIVHDGKWPQAPWAPFLLCGQQLSSPDYVVGFVGFGRIAQATLTRLVAFGVSRCLFTTSTRKVPDEAYPGLQNKLGLKEFRSVTLDEIARESDLIIVLTPGGPSTYHLVDETFLRKMKKTSVLVNTARGSVVDSNALALALRGGWIWGAGIDVVEGEPDIDADHILVKEPRAVVLPHIGSATYDTRNAMTCTAAENLVRGLKGEKLLAEVEL
ncbi:uncharacterized protein EI90DRAFT_3145919 [Cantharellus anzutake]|uniref:uncharacterized protein n=1 Tax=Cantharellus anzutake TaxID=1750568 RepID=UPI0019044250|nr:uncharacterized protein EI90DRAFT_3145919 [Cantharellus anzutake]KAF8329399.1 hypothetical protein EI90DRAFT_3145919 [Cantharellus anzutake]